MGKAPFGRVCNILGIYDTPAPATSELADAQSADPTVAVANDYTGLIAHKVGL